MQGEGLRVHAIVPLDRRVGRLPAPAMHCRNDSCSEGVRGPSEPDIAAGAARA